MVTHTKIDRIPAVNDITVISSCVTEMFPVTQGIVSRSKLFTLAKSQKLVEKSREF